jgi:hypothetical protein
LHKSTAFSQPTCTAQGLQSTTCNTNIYAYSLSKCSITPTNCLQPEGVALHDKNFICHGQVSPLRECLDERYHTFIVDGPTGPIGPTDDAFIEWHWYQLLGLAAPVSARFGKLTYMANSTWIKKCWDDNSGLYKGIAYPAGIPLFNPSNHNIN